MCAIEEELETKLGVFKITLNGMIWTTWLINYIIYWDMYIADIGI